MGAVTRGTPTDNIDHIVRTLLRHCQSRYHRHGAATVRKHVVNHVANAHHWILVCRIYHELDLHTNHGHP